MHEHFKFETIEDLNCARERKDELRNCVECTARLMDFNRRSVLGMLEKQRLLLEEQLAAAAASDEQGGLAKLLRKAIETIDSTRAAYVAACAESDLENPLLRLAADWKKADTEEPS